MLNGYTSCINVQKRDGQMIIKCPKRLKELLIESAIKSKRSLSEEVTLRLLHSLYEHDKISCAKQSDNIQVLYKESFDCHLKKKTAYINTDSYGISPEKQIIK